MIYYTNSEKWNFVYTKQKVTNDMVLAVKFRSAKHKAGFAHNADRDTTVQVKGIVLDSVKFDDYLFLSPPPRVLAPSTNETLYDNGYVCLGPEYAGSLYVKGIFIRKFMGDKSGGTFVHGYNILGDFPLTRDRDLPSEDSVLSSWVFDIWKSLLSDEGTRAEAAQLYIELFERHEKSLDIQYADEYFREIDSAADRVKLAQLLFNSFCDGHKCPGERIWVRDPELEEDHIICQIGRTPVKPPRDLYRIWREAGIVRTPAQERERLFTNSHICSPPDTAFAQHTIHLLETIRHSEGHSSSLKLVWKDGDRLDIDVLISASEVQLHARNLRSSYVHRNGPASCVMYAVYAGDVGSHQGIDVESLICDCAVLDVWSQIDAYISPPKTSDDSKKLREAIATRRNFTSIYPSRFNLDFSRTECIVSWKTFAGLVLPSFEVKIAKGGVGPGCHYYKLDGR